MDKRLELIADNTRLDITQPGSIPIKLSYVLQDFSNLDKRGGSFSNMFDIPGTKINNEFFQQYQQAGSLNSIQPFNTQKKSKVYFNGSKIFDGLLRGSSVSKLGGVPEKYKVNLIGNNMNWATTLSTMKLMDVVNVVRPSFTWDETFVRNSWGGLFNHLCPLVEYRGFWQTAPSSLPVETTHWWMMRPWLFVRPIVIEMFKQAGYVLQSEFIVNYQNLVCYFNDNGDADSPTFPKVDPGVSSLTIDYLSGLISPDRTCLDFLKGLIHNFNLYFNTDDNRRTVEMEQYNDFFDGGYYGAKELALDDIHDLSKETSFTNFDVNRYWILKHKFNDNPIPESGHQLDRYSCQVDFGQGFKEGVTVSENPFFAGCIMARHPQSSLRPAIISDWTNQSPLTPDLIGATEPRICLWAGHLDITPDEFQFEGDAIRHFIPYIYFHHPSDVPLVFTNPTENLSFKHHRKGSFIIPGVTENDYLNLIATMHRGRKITGSFRLTPQFIQNLNFTRRYFLEGVQVTLNEIAKWSPVDDETTEMELSKPIYSNTSDSNRLEHFFNTDDI